MTEYKLSIKNESAKSGNFCIYQKHPSHEEEIYSLQWFSKKSVPDTELSFQWDSAYTFARSEIGMLAPGALEAEANNAVTLPSQPQYWIAFGDFEEGETLDISRIEKTEQLFFPEGGGELAVTLDEHGNLRSDRK